MEQPTHDDIPGAVPAAVDARIGIVDNDEEAVASFTFVRMKLNGTGT